LQKFIVVQPKKSNYILQINFEGVAEAMVPHPIDTHVGKRLRSRRTLLGMSQEKLGEAVGVTFQQIQKYERGLNRIGSSRLYEFARVLSNPVSYFFDGIEEVVGEAEVKSISDDKNRFEYESIANKEVLSLVRAFSGITDQKIRKDIISLVKSLSNAAVEAQGSNQLPLVSDAKR
jgi:transcriptional regulator with XRE-family HTH domain